MTIVDVTEEIRTKLRVAEFSPMFLDNCLNSKFLAIEEYDSRIVGACFVGGILNSNGIEILDNFRGKGLGKKFLNEVLEECKKRKIPFLTGVFKPSNIVSIQMHLKIGYKPLFTFHYNKLEGKEVVVMLPLSQKGSFLMHLLRIFNTKLGNFIFAILLILLRPFLSNLIAFSSSKMPKVDFFYSIRNFESVENTMKTFTSII